MHAGSRLDSFIVLLTIFLASASSLKAVSTDREGDEGVGGGLTFGWGWVANHPPSFITVHILVTPCACARGKVISSVIVVGYHCCCQQKKNPTPDLDI